MPIFDFHSNIAGGAISKVYKNAEDLQNNANGFKNAISELSQYFSGAVSVKFMQQAEQHATDLATNASQISNVGSTLSSIKAKAEQEAENVSR